MPSEKEAQEILKNLVKVERDRANTGNCIAGPRSHCSVFAQKWREEYPLNTDPYTNSTKVEV